MILNRIVASSHNFADFLAMCLRLKVSTIELRNDLKGLELLDGAAPKELKKQADGAGISIITINALQRFEQWSGERATEAKNLSAAASELGCMGLVLCPTNSIKDTRSNANRGADLGEALKNLAPILRDYNITGLIEPLGFSECALRQKRLAVEALEEYEEHYGTNHPFKLLHDSFHHHIGGDASLYPERTALIHCSGVVNETIAVPEMRDSHRVLVDANDRLETMKQISQLRQAGCTAPLSLEPFADEICLSKDIENRLAESIGFMAGC